MDVKLPVDIKFEVDGLPVEFVEDACATCSDCVFDGVVNVNDVCIFDCDNGYFKYVSLPQVPVDYLGVECPECGEVIEVSNPTIREAWQCPECETFFEVNIDGLSD